MKDNGLMHAWVYVITPSGKEPLFAAYCKQCDTYFTRLLKLYQGTSRPFMAKLELPKTGCEPSGPYAPIKESIV